MTKLIAVDRLVAVYVPHAVVGDALRFTLVYNPGAAFGLHLGPYSRWIFTALTIGALVLLYKLYRETERGDLVRVIAIALVSGARSATCSTGFAHHAELWISSTSASARRVGQPLMWPTWP